MGKVEFKFKAASINNVNFFLIFIKIMGYVCSHIRFQFHFIIIFYLQVKVNFVSIRWPFGCTLMLYVHR